MTRGKLQSICIKQDNARSITDEQRGWRARDCEGSRLRNNLNNILAAPFSFPRR